MGIEKGIKFIANNTVRLAILIMLFLFIFGPTLQIINLLTNTIGDYLQNLVYMSLWTDPFIEGGWISGWTVFYWAWWIAWGPFVGQFIARISRGRTIREFIIGALIAPTIFSFIWLAIFGGTALNLDFIQGAGIGAAVLLVAGGLGALQTASIASAFPFMLVMLVMCYSMIKGLSQDKI